MLNTKYDVLDVKKNNQLYILKAIFNKGVISRAEISKQLKLSKPAVNEHIDTLLKKGIIIEIGEGISASKGGRKPILITPNESYKYIIAIDLNYTKPLIALGNLLGSPVDKFRLPPNWNIKNTNDILKDAIDKILIENKISIQQIGVIVVSLPGIVNDSLGKIIFNPQHESLHRLNLKKFLKDNYSLSVIIKNDVNMSAIGEEKFLRNDGKNSLFYLSCGNGLGSGIIINGNLYEGNNKAAGEVGYFLDINTGKSLEEIITIRALIQEIKTAIDEGICTELSKKNNITFEDIVVAYNNNDKFVISLVKRIGYLLGICANNSIALLDVDTVVFGGDYIAFKETIIPEITKVFEKSPLVIKPQVMATSLDYAGGIIGCFEVAINFIIERLNT